MKLRIKGNSIRLRLSQKEVEEFAMAGMVEDQISFGKTKLTYCLKETKLEEIKADYQSDIIIISVPSPIKQTWTTTEQVGFNTVINTEGQSLAVLVEKDFQCLVPRSEDESDLYVNPRNDLKN